ncbi:metal-dependent hydrolase [Legionella hackeliae]|uniref:Putative integral membrane protein n=1 Tax=Legionella hackeliae TaxID=449 RepID=A0A0A8URK9_LEGHA|nr:metal-dependent hydrolase [Legionella hackeliae]KTD10221.1 integral membrane protein [Legionella hackeliae]CEK09717.1 putative integral membrane protein [Legionella hackeliae]STX49626.1 membrane-bound metal-dependent hydrolase [Legionella hackeliae]
MDPVTQGALGAACAQAILHKNDKHNAWIVGGLAGMAADLDILINSTNDPILFFIYHRHFTHSLSFIPIGAALVSLFLILFKRLRKAPLLTFLAALIGYATHGLLDACTNYGTLLYWPFSNTRVSWDLISIIDPFFTFPLILGLVWTIINDDVKGVLLGIVLAGIVLLFNAFQHQRAMHLIQSFEKQHRLTLQKKRAFPKMTSSTLWRGIGVHNNRFYALDMTVPLLGQGHTRLIANYPLASHPHLPDYLKNSPSLMRDFFVFYWFTDGYIILAKRLPLMVADGRFLLDENPTISLWGILFLENHPHIQRLSSIQLDK